MQNACFLCRNDQSAENISKARHPGKAAAWYNQGFPGGERASPKNRSKHKLASKVGAPASLNFLFACRGRMFERVREIKEMEVEVAFFVPFACFGLTTFQNQRFSYGRGSTSLLKAGTHHSHAGRSPRRQEARRPAFFPDDGRASGTVRNVSRRRSVARNTVPNSVLLSLRNKV